jgi:hypothetical protein
MPQWEVTVVQRRRNGAHHMWASGGAVLALVAAVIVVSGRGHAAAGLLSMNSWSWMDKPMTVDPTSAATQAASLASVAKQGFLAEKHKLAQLQMVQAEKVSGALEEGEAQPAQTVPAASFKPRPFSSEVAQRLSAVNGAAQRAQEAASHILGTDRPLSRGPGTGAVSYMASQMALPTRTTRNGLALDFFHLTSLPAAAAVRFAKREVAGAMAKPAPASPGLLSVDAMAQQAFQQGTATVVTRRQKAGILPMPINKGWTSSMKRVKEQVGEKLERAENAVAQVAKDAAVQDVAASAAVVGAVPVAAPNATDKALTAETAEVRGVHSGVAAGNTVEDRLGQLETEVKKLKAEKAMEDKLKALKAEEENLESKYPRIRTSGTASAMAA